MRRVPGEEDPARPEPVGQRRPGPEVGGPADLGHVLGGEVRALGDDLADAVRRGVHLRALREPRHHLEVLRAGQRADGEEADPLARREDVPVVPVQAADPDVRHQRRARVDGLAGHADAERAPHRRAAAVRRDQVAGAQGPARGEVRGDALRVLCDPGDLVVEGDPAAQFREPRGQDLLRAPLRHHPRPVVRRVLARLGRLEHVVLTDPLAVPPDHADRVGGAHRVDRVDDAEVVEHLHRAGLEALAPRAREQRAGALQHQRVHPAPGEVDAQGETGGARADDQYIRVQGMRFHDFHGNSP